MKKSGYFKMSRKQYLSVPEGGCPFWNESRVFSRHEAWEDLIQMAAWTDHERVVRNQPVTLERGQVLASVRFLAQRWQWSRGRVSTFLALLVDLGRILRQQTTRNGDIYSLANYGSYQGGADTSGTAARTGKGRDRDATGPKIKKGKKRELTYCPEPSELASEPEEAEEMVMVFPVKAAKGRSREWGLPKPKLAEYESTFEGVDVLAELRVALQWCRDNPQRRKTARGMLRFLGSWLQRANDRGRMAKKSAEPEEVAEPKWTRHDLRFDGRLAEEGGKRFSAYFGEQVAMEEWRPFVELEAELGPCAGEVFRG